VLVVVVGVQEFRAKRRFAVSMWRVAALLVVVLYLSRSLHPVYAKNGELGYHGVWHAPFYQLQRHPDWKKKYASAYDNAAGDTLPQAAARNYLEQHPPSDPESVYLDPDHKQIKAWLRESYVVRHSLISL
jgi:hypothetical protein